jgi:hypothetical protein
VQEADMYFSPSFCHFPDFVLRLNSPNIKPWQKEGSCDYFPSGFAKIVVKAIVAVGGIGSFHIQNDYYGSASNHTFQIIF